MSSGRRRPPDIEGMVSLKVDNLTYKTTPENLKRIFDRYGEVGDVYIPRDPYNQESRGFAFVRYFDQRDADDAIDALDGTMMDGREIRVQLARHARPSTNPYGGGGRRGSSGRSSGYRSNRRSYSRSRSTSRSRRRRHSSRSRSRSRSATPEKKSSRSRREEGSRSPAPAAKASHSRSRSKGRANNGASRSRSRSPG